MRRQETTVKSIGVASMEPPPIGGGNDQRPRLPKPNGQRLQWSRLQSEAVMAPLLTMPYSLVGLQWSRLQSEAVIRDVGRAEATRRGASMEPPPIGGGNFVSAIASGLGGSGLQWSRLQSEAVIFPPGSCASGPSLSFNGAASNRRR